MPTKHSGAELLARVNAALDAAEVIFSRFTPGHIAETNKVGGDPVTEADLELDRVLKGVLCGDGEGWLSEETADDTDRLTRDLVWIVDPLDGTREFVEGIPEFCTSIAAAVDGVPVAGGVLNPAAGIRITGAVGMGVSTNVPRSHPRRKARSLEEMSVLASRSEVARGEWSEIEASGLSITPMGSVAYKMARVSAGLDDATWTAVPKHEWDVAGGTALLIAAGGSTVDLDGKVITFNRPQPWIEGAIAVPAHFEPFVPEVLRLIGRTVA